jgi:hypothetical protein
MSAPRPEPSLGQVRDEILSHVDLDGRVRRVEVEQATTRAEVAGLREQIAGVRDEQRAAREEVRTTRIEVLAAIEANKPKPVWPAVSALVAAVALILVVAQALYGQ